MKNLIQQGLALRELLRERILVLDGAMGTMLQQANLPPRISGAPSRRLQRKPEHHAAGCGSGIHRKYLEAGADIIETNTFGQHAACPRRVWTWLIWRPRNQPARGRACFARLCRRVSRKVRSRASWQARWALRRRQSVSRVAFTFSASFNKNYLEGRLAALSKAGADLLFFFETCQDTRNIKAGSC